MPSAFRRFKRLGVLAVFGSNVNRGVVRTGTPRKSRTAAIHSARTSHGCFRPIRQGENTLRRCQVFLTTLAD